ncbi:MAG: leucyl/phenylalanyl-tRNA--protein transferase [Acidobacteriota bacterium]|nr:leucyl/phenylalanyl-tRNA--protein transferase [Acidobacteriota bacterium]
MVSINFPNPRLHEFTEWVSFGDFFYNARDIIGFGGEMTVANLRSAYRAGIFPWGIENLPLPWFCPESRAVLEFSDLHVPKSLQKERRKTDFTFTLDKDFRAVIESCSNVERSHEKGTWITEEFVEAYCRFHAAGDAHSVEVWAANGDLVGGLYGVDAGGVFCGESMFHRRSNASKMALLFLIEHLQTRGAAWLDVQVMTPHFEVLGAKEIHRAKFLDRLETTQKLNLKLF